MEGANVTVATSGEQALQLLDGKPPALILSDLGLHGMSGFEFIEAVRRRPDFANVKAVALSGYGTQSNVEDALHAGFDAHLTKSVMLDVLLSTIARLRAR
jgi:two-component system, chemotaxis family, CheB/CheR fusion protein